MKILCKLVLFLAIALSALPLFAQKPQPSFRLGAGYNISWMQQDAQPSSSIVFRPQGMMTLDLPFSEKISAQLGAGMVGRGGIFRYKDIFKSKETNQTAVVDQTHNVTLWYLQVPLHLRYRILLVDDFYNPTHLFVKAGAYIEYCVDGTRDNKYKHVSGEFKPGTSMPQNYKDDFFAEDPPYYSRKNYGLSGGVGVEHGRWVGEIIYDHGLEDIQVRKNLENYDNDMLLRSVALSIGYRF